MVKKKCLLSIFASIMTTFLLLKPISVLGVEIEDQNIDGSIDIDSNDSSDNDNLDDEIISGTIQDEKIIFALKDDDYSEDDTNFEEVIEDQDIQCNEPQYDYSIQEDNSDIVTGTITDQKIVYADNNEQTDESGINDSLKTNQEPQVEEVIQNSNNEEDKATNTSDSTNMLTFAVSLICSIFVIKKIK